MTHELNYEVRCYEVWPLIKIRRCLDVPPRASIKAFPFSTYYMDTKTRNFTTQGPISNPSIHSYELTGLVRKFYGPHGISAKSKKVVEITALHFNDKISLITSHLLLISSANDFLPAFIHQVVRLSSQYFRPCSTSNNIFNLPAKQRCLRHIFVNTSF